MLRYPFLGDFVAGNYYNFGETSFVEELVFSSSFSSSSSNSSVYEILRRDSIVPNERKRKRKVFFFEEEAGVGVERVTTMMTVTETWMRVLLSLIIYH